MLKLGAKRMFLAGVVVVAGLSTAGAVAGVGAKQPNTAPVPDLGATVRFATLGGSLTLDPIRWPLGGSYQGLVAFDRLTTLINGKPSPQVALSWSTSKNRATGQEAVTFKLRPGVKFNDGTPVNAAAVKASVLRARNNPLSLQASQLQDIASIDAVNATTVRFNMAFGGAELPAVFASGAGAVINPICIANNTDLTLPPAQCTSSPYVVDTSKTKMPLDFWFTRDPAQKNHFDGLPKASEVEVLGAGSSTNALNALQAGQVDVAHMTSESVAQGKQVIASSGGKYTGTEVFVGTILSVNFNVHKPPFDNPLLRKAVYSAIDPKTLNYGLFAGNCRPDRQPYLPTFWAYNPKFKSTLSYNPTAAKSYLAQAGMPNGFTFTLSYYPISLFQEAAVAIQGELSQVGITANLQSFSPGGPQQSQGAYQAQMLNTGSVLDPSQQVSSYFQVGGTQYAWPAVGDPIADQLNTARYHALDPRLTLAQRAAVYNKIWTIVNNQETWIVPICAEGLLFVHNQQTYGVNTPQFLFDNGYVSAKYLYKTK